MRIRKSLTRSLERLLIGITIIPLVGVLIVVPITMVFYFLVYVPQTVEVGWLVLRSPESKPSRKIETAKRHLLELSWPT